MKFLIRNIPAIVILIMGLVELWFGLHGPMWIKMLENKLWIQPEYGQTASRALAPDIALLRAKLLYLIWFGLGSILLSVSQMLLTAKSRK